jgi:hypothetical protein
VFVVLVSVAAVAAGPSAVWLKVNPPNSPPARAAMAMAYDGIGKKVVMFGGFDATGYLNDTWTFNGATWTPVFPATSPSPRAASAISFDRVTGKLIMFGGFNGSQYLGDTWIWDGQNETWTQAHPGTNPDPVTLPMMFTDPLNGHAGMFGGFDGRFYQDTTWQWTGSDWKNMRPVTFPYARGAAIVSNDFAHKTVVIYGGLADVNPLNTWTWDGTNWTQQNPSIQPDSTYYAAAAYDPVLAEVIMFGGGSGLNTTWAWTGSDWITVPTLHSPSARESLGMVYDVDSKQLLIFGGQAGNTLLNGTYKLVKR